MKSILFFTVILLFQFISISQNNKDGQCISGDCENGYGNYTYKSGQNCIANWIDGKRNGYGTCIWPDGDKYDGNFIDDKRSGFGIYKYANNDIWEGNWDNHKFVSGKKTFSDGTVIEGLFDNDKLLKTKQQLEEDRNLENNIYKGNNSTSQTTTNNTTTSNINDFESNVNNISDINSRLKYIQNVIGTAASQNDTKLLTRAIIQYNSNILSDPNIDKELFIFGRLINESSLPQILQNGISEDEKSMFSVSSFYYVMCQLNIENNFDALNKDIVNGILNNFSSNSYFSKDLYLALEKKKNEIQNSANNNSNSQIATNNSTTTPKFMGMDLEEAEVFFTTLRKLNEKSNNSNSNEQSKNSSNNNEASTTRNAQWVDVKCTNCNLQFKFKIWNGGQHSSGNYWGGWGEETNTRSGYVKCKGCTGYGINWDYDGKNPTKSSCKYNCSGGWEKCSKCYGKGTVRELH